MENWEGRFESACENVFRHLIERRERSPSHSTVVQKSFKLRGNTNSRTNGFAHREKFVARDFKEVEIATKMFPFDFRDSWAYVYL